jgi:rhamnogalacturonan endolyase
MTKVVFLKNIFLSILVAAIFADFAAAGVRVMENLDRGVVAVRTSSSQVYVGWRMLGTEWGQNIGYNVYRNGIKITSSPITASTNYVDSFATDGVYGVSAVIDGVEGAVSKSVNVWNTNYLSIPLQIPEGVTTPDGVTSSYRANDCSVGDLDGDGEYEIVVKWDPSNSQDNSISGYTGNVYLDAYKLDGTFLWRIDLGINIRAGAHYTQFMVYDLDSDGKAEVACKTAPYTKDGLGNTVLLGSDTLTDYRNTSGYILSGPEYLTVFNGQTGAAMATTNYNPPRGTVSSWGDSYGNRVDRFLACVAYLDGVHPSLVMCRGYYTRAVLAAWDWRDGQLTQRWVFDSNNSGYSSYAGQGCHSLSVAEVDEDGKDEIIYGACAIDDNGAGLYNTGLGHGDALHVSDMDPDRPGLEVWQCHESSPYGASFRDAKTGEVIFRYQATADTGRACAGDITSGSRGYEMWAAGSFLYSCTGATLGSGPSPKNFMSWWDGDLLREFLDGSDNSKVTTAPVISKYGGSTLLSASGCYSNNTTKATPCLSGDILGDWREEVIFRTSDNTALRIYTTTAVTTHRLYTLMHDCQYREAIAWQNVAYNQPPHPSFYLGDGMSPPPTPQIQFPQPPLYGDFDDDSFVNINDLLPFLDLWLVNDCARTAKLDLNADCIVNYVEFSAMAANWTGPDTIAPSAPSGVWTSPGYQTVALEWADNSEGDLSGYNIYRSTILGSGYVKLNQALLTVSNYTDNDVVNGTTYYYVITAADISFNESAYSSEVSATPNLIIQENTTGFCGVDSPGTIDNNHAGFTGTGFINANNAIGAGINWSISIPAAGTYTFTWRYSNASGSRPGNLIINGSTVLSNISFPNTASWTTWTDVSVSVSLSVGVQSVRLEATTANGPANIDYLMVAGNNPHAASCP